MILTMEIGNDEDEFAIYYPVDRTVSNVMVWLMAYPPAIDDGTGNLPDQITVEIKGV